MRLVIFAEVNKGCASMDRLASAKTREQEIYLCEERLCNSATTYSLLLPLLSLFYWTSRIL